MTSTKKIKKGGDRDVGENEEKKKGSEGAVQETTFNYFSWPQTKDLDLIIIGLSVVSEFVVGV